MATSLRIVSDKEGLPRPLRLPPREAAALLNLHPVTLRKLVVQGIFTIVPYRGTERGVGKRYFLLTEEVEIYATQGEDALKEYRAKKKNAKRRG